jgi:hypothetical protein
MAKGDVQQSPYVANFGDYMYDPGTNPDAHVIRLTVNFDNTTRAITNVVVFRDAACLWTKVFIGLGPDGTPNSSPQVFDLTGFSGSRTFTATQVSHQGFNTIEDVLAKQITAGN